MPKFNVLLLVLLSLYTHVIVNRLNLKYIQGVPTKKRNMFDRLLSLHSVHQNCSMMAHFKGDEITEKRSKQI